MANYNQGYPNMRPGQPGMTPNSGMQPGFQPNMMRPQASQPPPNFQGGGFQPPRPMGGMPPPGSGQHAPMQPPFRPNGNAGPPMPGASMPGPPMPGPPMPGPPMPGPPMPGRPTGPPPPGPPTGPPPPGPPGNTGRYPGNSTQMPGPPGQMMSRPMPQMSSAPPPSFGSPGAKMGGPPMPGPGSFVGSPPGQPMGGRPGPPPPQNMAQVAPPAFQPNPQVRPPQFGSQTYDGSGTPLGAESILGQFQSITMNLGGPITPGQSADMGVNTAEFPRPTGDNPEVFSNKARLEPYSCNPKFMRMSVNAIPNSAEKKREWCMPCGALIQPLAQTEKEVPVVNFGSAGIIRCRQCRTYVNPYVQFTDGGRRWKCNVCGTFNEVPVEYFCTTDHNGVRRDIDERPELNSGSVEYVAPAEYMVRAPMPPVYVFLFDVSYPAVVSGMLNVAVQAVRSCLASLPGGERTQVGFVTYDSTLHFYNAKPGASSPQIMVVPDVASPYLPQPDDLLLNLQESTEQIEAVLSLIEKSYAKTQENEGSLGGAIQAAYLMTQHIGGKILVFQSSVSTLGDGKLRMKDDVTLYNTEKEYKLRIPDDPFFKRFGGECNRIQMCVDIFCGPPKYTDVASLATYTSCTGGQFYFYPGFFAKRDGLKLHNEVRRNLTREIGWEAVMRVRMGKGLRCSSFHGHFMIRSNDLMTLPTIDSDKAIFVQIGYEDQVVTHQRTYMQCALLYTTSSGERRIRVHTMAIPVVSDIGEMFKACDGCCTVACLTKLAAEKIRSATIKDTIQIVNKKCVDMFKEYRRLYSAHLHAQNKLILPETMKFVPLLLLCLQKSTLLRGNTNEVNADERSDVISQIISMPFDALMKYLYPSCYPLLDPSAGSVDKDGKVLLPPTLPLSLNNIKDNGVYLFDNGVQLYIWVGRGLSPKWLSDVFGVSENPTPQDLNNIQAEKAINNPTSQKVIALINLLRTNSATFQRCMVVRQGDPSEAQILQWLVEDKFQTMYSYTNYLGYIHKGILSRS